jgi:hypothetical protein
MGEISFMWLLYFHFLGTAFIVTAPFHIFTKSAQLLQFLYLFAETCYFSFFCKVVPHDGFDLFISLMFSDIQHFSHAY